MMKETEANKRAQKRFPIVHDFLKATKKANDAKDVATAIRWRARAEAAYEVMTAEARRQVADAEKEQ